MRIGENIKRLRENAGMTQEELAEALGKTRGAVTQWEIGWSAPRLGAVEDIAALFGVPISAIVDDSPTLEDNSEVRLLRYYRSMNSEGRRTLLNTAESLAMAFPPNRVEFPRTVARGSW